MATLAAVNSVHATLAIAVVDSVTLTPTAMSRIKITNRDTSTSLYYRWDGVDPAIGGSESFIVLPGTSDTFQPLSFPVEVRIIAVLGVGYSLMVIP